MGKWGRGRDKAVAKTNYGEMCLCVCVNGRGVCKNSRQEREGGHERTGAVVCV